MGHSPQENSVMRSSPTPAENRSSCLKSETYISHLSEWEILHSPGLVCFQWIYHHSQAAWFLRRWWRLCTAPALERSAPLDSAAGTSRCSLKQYLGIEQRGGLEDFEFVLASFIWSCVFKAVPCLCTTTLPSVLLLVRAMKKPSTCIMGDAESTFSASDPCWSAEDPAHSSREKRPINKNNNQMNATLWVQLLKYWNKEDRLKTTYFFHYNKIYISITYSKMTRKGLWLEKKISQLVNISMNVLQLSLSTLRIYVIFMCFFFKYDD